MGFLSLAVACSLGIATVFKLAERRDLDRTALLAANYAAAAALATVLQGADVLATVPPGAVLLGVVEGVLYIGGFWLFARAIREAGMGLAAAAMRLSVVLPVAASWAVWAEAPTVAQGAGLVLAGGAFVLLSRPEARAEAPDAEAPRVTKTRLLALLFVVGGMVDVLMKAFQTVYGAAVPAPTFLLFVFGVAFALGAAAVGVAGFRTGAWPRLEVLAWGAGLGALNYASADLFLRALGTLPAPVAFPLNSVAVVIGAALLGRFVWSERFSRAQAAGLAFAVAAVALLAR